MLRLVVTEAAHGDLDEAFAYVATVLENPAAAVAFGTRSGGRPSRSSRSGVESVEKGWTPGKNRVGLVAPAQKA